jgi:hypothetical protein
MDKTLKEIIRHEFDELKCNDLFSLTIHEFKNGSVKIRLDALANSGFPFALSLKKIVHVGEQSKLTNEIKQWVKRLKNE